MVHGVALYGSEIQQSHCHWVSSADQQYDVPLATDAHDPALTVVESVASEGEQCHVVTDAESCSPSLIEFNVAGAHKHKSQVIAMCVH